MAATESSVPLPPPPPPISPPTQATTPTPITNGGTDTDKSSSVSPKPKTPHKPYRLTRAFSTGSMTFGRMSWKKKRKSKILEEEQSAAVIPIQNGLPVQNGHKGSVINGFNELINWGTVEESAEEKEKLWKLPGIKDASQKQLKSPKTLKTTTSDTSLLLGQRELPPLPTTPASEPETWGENRQLPPSPPPTPNLSDSAHNKSPPETPVELSLSSDVATTEATTSIETVLANTSSLISEGANSPVESAKWKRELSPIPETPPTSDDSDSGIKLRLLPKTPPYPDYDEDDGKIAGALSGQKDGFVNPERNEDCGSKVEGNGESQANTDTPYHSPEPPVDVTSMQEETTAAAAVSDLSPGLPTVHVTDLSPGLPTIHVTHAADNTIGAEIVDTREAVPDYTIGEIVSSYSYAFPARVRILQGYCSDTMEVNISTDDVYDVHSVQHTEKMIVKDKDSMTHRVSLNAPVKVGLIYNPKNNYDESLLGYSFKSVFEVTLMPVLPRVIAATQAVSYEEEANSISEGEILIVKQVQRSLFKGHKRLKVFSLLTNSIKILPDDCQGVFCTKPSLVKMNPSELLERVADIFPSRGVIYPTSDDVGNRADFPGSLSRVVTLLDCSTDTVLVVSDVSFMDERELAEANLAPVPLTSPTSFDLLLDDDISTLEVAVLKWTYPEEVEREEEEFGHLYDDTKELVNEILNSSEDLREGDQLVGAGLVVPAKDVVPSSTLEPTYINLAEVESSSMTEKEKLFLEEDEDAGYDIVGLHLIRANQPTTSSPEPLPSAQGVPSYSSIQRNHPPKKKSIEDPPFENHGYSTVHQNRAPKNPLPGEKPGDGYFRVAQHSGTVNGVVIALKPEVDVSAATTKDRATQGTQRTQDRSDGEEVGSAGGGTRISTMIDSFESRLKAFQSTQQSADVVKMQSMLEKLTAKLETVDSQLNTLTSSPKEAASKTSTSAAKISTEPEETQSAGKNPAAPEETESMEESNRNYLRTLDVQQVGRLMAAMSLGQYQQKAEEEQISGEILMECDESILEEEIGVKSRIHRIRIMKIISGQHSAKALLEKS